MNDIPLNLFTLRSPHTVLIRAGYVLLQQMDLFMTMFALSRGAVELNPFMISLLDSPVKLILIKIVFPVLLAWVVPAKLLVPALGFILLVNALNTVQLFHLLGW